MEIALALLAVIVAAAILLLCLQPGLLRDENTSARARTEPLSLLPARKGGSTGIVILSQDTSQRCALCCTRDGLACRCLDCGAPYHDDCWTFVGRCAVYG